MQTGLVHTTLHHPTHRTRFWDPSGSHFGLPGALLGPFWLPFWAPRGFLGRSLDPGRVLLRHLWDLCVGTCFSHRFWTDFGLPRGPPLGTLLGPICGLGPSPEASGWHFGAIFALLGPTSVSTSLLHPPNSSKSSFSGVAKVYETLQIL